MRPLVLVLFALLAAADAAATGFTILRDGAPAAGDICRFAAGDRLNPFQRWLSSTEVVCESGPSIAIPAGLWNVFARSSDAISSPELIEGGDAAPDRVTLVLGSGATIEIPADRRAIVYLPRRAIAYPLAGRNTIPADQPLWLFALDKGKVSRVIPLPALEAGSVRTVDLAAPATRSTLAWIQVPEADPSVLRRVGAPRVYARVEEREHESDPLPPGDEIDGAIVRIAGLPPGEATIAAGGDLWVPQVRRVEIAEGVTTVEQPLVLHGATALIVRWSTPDDLSALDRSLPSCQPLREPVRLEIVVSNCTAACRTVKTERYPLDARRGEISLDGLAPGLYRAELRYGRLPAFASSTQVSRFQRGSITIAADYRELTGTILRDEKPFDRPSTVRFGAAGAGFARDGKYVAIVTGWIMPETEVDVAACNGSMNATLLTDTRIPPDSRYDIEIPSNALQIEVIDTFTRLPVNGATIRYTLLSRRAPRVPVLTKSVTLQADTAHVALVPLPLREISLVVSHPEYEKTTIPPFALEEGGTKRVEVQMLPLRGDRGRVVSNRPFENATIYWFAGGRETEHADLAPDGVFVSAGGHRSDEVMVIVSASHPLWILRAPSLDPRRPIEIRFPDETPPRDFEVSMKAADSRDSRYFGLIVGGLRVPLQALVAHLNLRRTAPIVRGTAPTPVNDIAAAGSIEAILGPRTERLRRADYDPFFTTPFSEAERVPVGKDDGWVVLRPPPNDP